MNTTLSPNAPVEISSYTHPVLRWGLGLFGAFVIGVSVYDLGRAVWPLSIVSPFFGLLLAIAVSIGSVLVASVIWGPDERWIIDDGHLSIIYQRFGQSRTIDHPYTHFEQSTIESSQWDSGPDTYLLELHLTAQANGQAGSKIPAQFSFMPAVLFRPLTLVSGAFLGQPARKNRLRSPHFEQRADAEAALARLMRL